MSVELPKNIKLLAWFNFFLELRFYAPIAILYFSNVSGSFALGMSVFSITMISSAIFELPTGIYSDLIGRKKTMVWGAVASLFSVLAYALAKNYQILVVGAAFEGLARAFYSGNNEAFLMDTLKQNKLQQRYAKYLASTSAMLQWSLTLVALLSGVIASYSFALLMWVSVIPAGIGLLIASLMEEPENLDQIEGNIYVHLQAALQLFQSNYDLRTLSLAKIIGYAGSESSYQFRAAFINTLWPLWAVGFAKMLSNVGAAISYRFSEWLTRHYRPLKILMIGKTYSLFSNILAFIYPTIFSPVLLASNSLLYGPTDVTQTTLLQQHYSDKQRSTMGSLNSLVGSLAYALVAILLGVGSDYLGPAKALLLLQVFSVVSLYLLWKVFRSGGK